jgi:RNA polymerase sigma factor (TIGR02999 family)
MFFGYPTGTVADEPGDITILLSRWRKGAADAGDRLMQVIHGELRKIAASHLRRERAGHTLQPTEVVHEAFLRLLPQKVHWENRQHFYGIASAMMRRILVDHARKKKAGKREGPGGDPVSLSIVADPRAGINLDFIALDQALDKLQVLDPRAARMLELKFFAGLTNDEVAEMTDVSVSTVKREIETAMVAMRYFMDVDTKGSKGKA